MIQGTLIPIGGNEDKGVHKEEKYKLEYISQGILARVLKESGGKDSKILVITTASGIPKEVGNNYIAAFKLLGCENVEPLYIGSRAEADSPENLKKIRSVDCVMFSGGNQSKITSKIKDTEFHEIIADRYQNENFVVAGTSAGAMCMSAEMISGGSIKESFIKASTKMREGMNLIPEIIIDTHFIQRGRFGRLSEAVAKFPSILGIGLAEDTGMVIKNGNDCETIGSGMVIVFDGGQLTHNKYHQLKKGTTLTLCNLVTHVLSPGDTLDIKNKKIEVLSASASLI